MSNEVNINVNVNVNVNVTVKTRASYPGRKAYDNREVKENEVLVPMMVDDELIHLLGNVDRRNLRTWRLAGRSFKVMFYPVDAGSEEIAWKQFYAHVSEFLGEHRDLRCYVPQPDDSYKLCQKKDGTSEYSAETVRIVMSISERIRIASQLRR